MGTFSEIFFTKLLFLKADNSLPFKEVFNIHTEIPFLINNFDILNDKINNLSFSGAKATLHFFFILKY